MSTYGSTIYGSAIYGSVIYATLQYTVTFVASDTRSTATGELSWKVYTAAGATGTLLLSGTATSGAAVTTSTIDDPGLADGTNTRYLYITDGAGNILDQSFTVQASLPGPGQYHWQF
jgi:hypothetical protein